MVSRDRQTGSGVLLLVIGLAAVALASGLIFGGQLRSIKTRLLAVISQSATGRTVTDWLHLEASRLSRLEGDALSEYCHSNPATAGKWGHGQVTLSPSDFYFRCKKLGNNPQYVFEGSIDPVCTHGGGGEAPCVRVDARLVFVPTSENCGPQDQFSCPVGLAETDPTRWGQGTAEKPYCLCTASQLDQISTQMTTDASLKSAHFKLMADIDMSLSQKKDDSKNRPIGPGFAGAFDGNQKALSNLRVNWGLFDCLGSWVHNKTRVERLVLKNPIIEATEETESSSCGGRNMGALANTARTATISKVRVIREGAGSANSVRLFNEKADKASTGGLVGVALATVLQDVAFLALDEAAGSIESNDGPTGGIVGSMGSFTLYKANRPSDVPDGTPWPRRLGSLIERAEVRVGYLTGAVAGGIAGEMLDSTIQHAQVRTTPFRRASQADGNFGIGGVLVGGVVGKASGLHLRPAHEDDYTALPKPPSGGSGYCSACAAGSSVSTLERVFCEEGDLQGGPSGPAITMGGVVGSAYRSRLSSAHSACGLKFHDSRGTTNMTIPTAFVRGGVVGEMEASSISSSESSAILHPGSAVGVMGGVLGVYRRVNQTSNCSQPEVLCVEGTHTSQVSPRIDYSRFSGVMIVEPEGPQGLEEIGETHSRSSVGGVIGRLSRTSLPPGGAIHTLTIENCSSVGPVFIRNHLSLSNTDFNGSRRFGALLGELDLKPFSVANDNPLRLILIDTASALSLQRITPSSITSDWATWANEISPALDCLGGVVGAHPNAASGALNAEGVLFDLVLPPPATFFGGSLCSGTNPAYPTPNILTADPRGVNHSNYTTTTNNTGRYRAVDYLRSQEETHFPMQFFSGSNPPWKMPNELAGLQAKGVIPGTSDIVFNQGIPVPRFCEPAPRLLQNQVIALSRSRQGLSNSQTPDIHPSWTLPPTWVHACRPSSASAPVFD